MGEIMAFSTVSGDKKKKNGISTLISFRKIYSKWVTELNVKVKTMKLLKK